MILRTLTAGVLTVTTFLGVSPTGEPQPVRSASMEPLVVVAPKPIPTPTEIAQQSYDFGERGSSVRRLQQVIKATTDGVYGTSTWSAHRAYLIANSLSTATLPDVPTEYANKWYTVHYKKQKISLPLDKSKRCIKYEGAFRRYGLPVDIMSYVSWRESRCDVKAVGWNYKHGKSAWDCKRQEFKKYLVSCKAWDTFDSGLLQVNSSWYSVTKELCGATPQSGILRTIDCNLKVSKFMIDSNSYPMRNWGF
jgi:hypothetical protein